MPKQSKIFLDSEGNEWYKRNSSYIKKKDYLKDDFVINELFELGVDFQNTKVLEIGCADGSRLAFLKESFSCDVFGVEPSVKAVQEARDKGLNIQVGVADALAFDDAFFDVVIFGFCLYLCDRDDLFKIASEVNRVTKKEAWIVILDFFSKEGKENVYTHTQGVTSYKFDNRKMFDWHPQYTCIGHKIRSHNNFREYTDIEDEWIAVSIIRKKSD